MKEEKVAGYKYVPVHVLSHDVGSEYISLPPCRYFKEYTS
jgi:hypothetical protein